MKVTFNFKKSTCRLNWMKILKVVFGFNLKEAKANFERNKTDIFENNNYYTIKD